MNSDRDRSQGTVIVPTYLRPQWLERCLRALSIQTLLPEEVLVIGRHEDSAARDVTASNRTTAPFRVKWLEVDRPGHIQPVKLGLHAASGALVALLDDDTEPFDTWLEKLSECFRDDSTVACAGGRVITHGVPAHTSRAAGRIRWYGKLIGNIGALEAPEVTHVTTVMECNWMWRREVLEKLDFDTALDFAHAPFYGLHLTLQALRQQQRVVYTSEAKVRHHAAPRTASLDRSKLAQEVYAYSRNYTYIGLKYFHPVQKLVFVVWWWAIGQRGGYGLVTAAIDLQLKKPEVLKKLRAALAGKWAGLKLWISNSQGHQKPTIPRDSVDPSLGAHRP
jgi:GT2 family glycosyltransferase